MRRSRLKKGARCAPRTCAPRRPTTRPASTARSSASTPKPAPAGRRTPNTPAPMQNEKRIVAFGFRNPFRFTTDPLTQKVYVANVGGSQFEEIDRIDPSAGTLYNSGWPCYEGDGREYQFKDLESAALRRPLPRNRSRRAGRPVGTVLLLQPQADGGAGRRMRLHVGLGDLGALLLRGETNSRPNTRGRSSSRTRCGTAST